MSSDQSHWDLVVIGGDRVGHEVAHEAASRSARVMLVVPGAGSQAAVGSCRRPITNKLEALELKTRGLADGRHAPSHA